MDMYQKGEMRKNKKMDENKKVYHLRVSIGTQVTWQKPEDK